MPVTASVLWSTVMAFVTTAKALPPMPARALTEEMRGAGGSAGAPADAPKGDAATARPMVGDTKALQSEMDTAVDVCRSLLEEHVSKAVANVGLHLSVLASAAGLVPMIFKAKTGAEFQTILSAQPLLFGAAAAKAATQLAIWRDYVKAKIPNAGAVPGCVRLLEDPKALFARLPKDTACGLHAASLGVHPTTGVGTRHAMLEVANKKPFFRSVVSAMVESTAPDADTAHVKAVLGPEVGSTSPLLTRVQPFLDSPVAGAKTPQAHAPTQFLDRPWTRGSTLSSRRQPPMLRIHLSNARGADYEDVLRALKLVFGDNVDVGPEVVSKGVWPGSRQN